MEKTEILENISKSVNERLKIPIIITYISVLIIYNWDILFYLFFENSSASTRILEIKENYSAVYYQRILICLGISILLIVIFTALNTLLNLSLKWFYRKDKETKSEIENFEKINQLSEQLSQSIEKTKNLSSEIENLQKINLNLSSSILDIDISEISKKDYQLLLDEINSRADKEKIRYSLKQFIDEFKKNHKITKFQILNSATYEHEMKSLLEILQNRKLLKTKNKYQNGFTTEFFELNKSFEDILKLKT
ncbi:hypothetical protein [Salegentibacter salegens]|uniref:Uncharacterized protein n=1 Tax=Salegentibacter salegens TaxID=143223 RepID=A0A1M7K4F6_9FLAO|nr:hypothetical protein [Salegentibacter salegens]PRX43109.1 hypothetical protein LY58_02460 [Salegentibacter salegens]SHM60169.1 hypothetical protein SAMN05878281_1244 [Salegentibacter salegens]